MRIFIIALLLLLPGCSSTFLKDNISDVAGVTAGVVTTAATMNPGAGVAVGVGVAAGVNTLVPAEEEGLGDYLDHIPEDQRAEVLKTESFWMTIEEWGLYIIVGCFILVLAAWLIPGPQITFRRKNEQKAD